MTFPRPAWLTWPLARLVGLILLGLVLVWFILRDVRHAGVIRAWIAERDALAVQAKAADARSRAVADSLAAARDTIQRLDLRAAQLQGVVSVLRAKETALLAGLGRARTCADSLPVVVEGWSTCRLRADSLTTLFHVKQAAESTAVKALTRQVAEADSLRMERDRWKALAEKAPTSPTPITVKWPKYLPSVSAGLTACTNGSSRAVGVGVTLGYRLFPRP